MNTSETPGATEAGPTSIKADGPVREFVDFNRTLIESGCELLSRLDDEQYAGPVEPLSASTIGMHVRHCLDYYEAFLSGVASGTIDYDERPREALIENDRKAAIRRLEQVKGRLEVLSDYEANEPVSVTITSPDGRSERVTSSIPRELELAANHTIHHYAIIAIFARARGVEVDHSFGVALSTRRFRAAQES